MTEPVRAPKPPWAVRIAAGLLAAGCLLFISTVTRSYADCPQDDLDCAELKGAFAFFIVVAVLGSAVLMTVAWQFWRGRRWAWLVVLAWAMFAALWFPLLHLDEWTSGWFGERALGVLNLALPGALVLPPVLRWVRSRPAVSGSPPGRVGTRAGTGVTDGVRRRAGRA